MVRKKHQSKRLSASKRYKIERKVKEHHRKQRKEERLKPKSQKNKRDPGVPNLWPFKDKLLKEAADSKRKLEEEKQRQKELRKSLQNRNRNLNDSQVDMMALAASARQRAGKYEKKSGKEITYAPDGMIHDNSKRAFYNEFRKVVEAADVILEVLDARDPLGCRSKQVEEMILNAGSGKKIVLVLNKIDLVPREVAEKWLKFLRNEYPTVAFKASTQHQSKKIGQASWTLEKGAEGLLSSSECLGADSLMKLLKNYCRSANIKTAISVGVIGFPNVGKSSLINSLKRSKACVVGATPGVTKAAQEIHIDKQIKLIDCPGIVFVSGKTQADVLLLRNCLKVEQIEDPVSAVELLLKRCNKQQVSDIYSIPVFSNYRDFLVKLARQRGKLNKGGIANLEAASKIVLKDWNEGKIPYYVQPPKDERMLSAEVVSTFSTEFSLEDIDQEQADMLRSLGEKKGLTDVVRSVVAMEPSTAEVGIELGTFGDEESDEEAPELVPMNESEEEEVEAFSMSAKQKQKLKKKVAEGVVRKVPVADSELNDRANRSLKVLQKLIKKGKVVVSDEGTGSGEMYSFATDFVEMDDSDESGEEGSDDEGEWEDDDEEFDGIELDSEEGEEDSD